MARPFGRPTVPDPDLTPVRHEYAIVRSDGEVVPPEAVFLVLRLDRPEDEVARTIALEFAGYHRWRGHPEVAESLERTVAEAARRATRH